MCTCVHGPHTDPSAQPCPWPRMCPRPCTDRMYTARTRRCARPCTRSVYDLVLTVRCAHGVCSCSRLCTRPVRGRVHGPCTRIAYAYTYTVMYTCTRPKHIRVHGRVHGRTGRVHVHTIVYMAVYGPCAWPCTQGCTRAVHVPPRPHFGRCVPCPHACAHGTVNDQKVKCTFFAWC